MTKKVKYFLAIYTVTVGLVALFIITPAVDAYILSRWTTYNDRFTTVVQEQTEEDSMVILTFATSTTGKMILIDKSDIRNFPHIANAPIHITKIAVNWAATKTGGLVNASTTIKFGTMASTSPTSGAYADIKYFDRIDFDSDLMGSNQQWVSDYYPSSVKLDINSATTTGFLSADVEMNASTWATSTSLLTPRISKSGGVYYTGPNVGDLVMNLSRQNGEATINVKVWYHVKY